MSEGLESDPSRFFSRTTFCLRQLQPSMQSTLPQWVMGREWARLEQTQPSRQKSLRQGGVGRCTSWIGAVGSSRTKP